ALIEQLQGKNEIKEFGDGKDDTSVGTTTAEIDVYLNAVEKETKKDEKDKDKKKDEKDKKKDEKKDDKDAAAKIKKDAKPYVKLIIGTVDKDKKIAQVKRVLQDAPESRFSVPLEYVDKLHLDEGALAYIDTALPTQSLIDISAVDVQRGKEKIELDRVRDE